MAKGSNIKLVHDITSQWPEYYELLRDDARQMFLRFVVPMQRGYSFMVRDDEGHRLLVVWNKPEWPPQAPPRPAHWSNEGPYLWIMELVWDKGMDAKTATRLYLRELVSRGIAQEGDRVLFWRQNSGRYGHGTLRLRGQDGIRKQDKHVGKRPMGNDAPVDEGQLQA